MCLDMLLYQGTSKTQGWRNRQTRRFQVPVVSAVWVQVPSPAPRKNDSVDTKSFFQFECISYLLMFLSASVIIIDKKALPFYIYCFIILLKKVFFNSFIVVKNIII